MSSDPRIDHYIAGRAPFLQRILHHLRMLVHRACPDVVETMKWSAPAFVYKGQLLCSFAGFRRHATFGFWRGREVVDDTPTGLDAMGQFGRLTRLEDLPDDHTLIALIGRAMALTDSGAKPPRAPRQPRAEIAMPEDLAQALAADPVAAAVFAGFPPSYRRDYLEWITEAKRPETRSRRIAQAIEWIAQGRQRNWKYQEC